MNLSTLEQNLQETQEKFFEKPIYDKNAVLSSAALTDYLNDLRAEALRLKDEPLCELTFHAYKLYDTTGNRITFGNAYFQRRRCLGIFALMAWLYEEEEYVSLTEDYLWAMCNEYTWAHPAHLNGNSLNEQVNPLTLDLFACETAQTLAEITYLLKEQLHPAVIRRCQSEVERRVFNPFETRTTPYWWETCHMNWASVCAGSIGMAAIWQITDDSRRLASLLSQLLPVMDYFLSGFAPDGACLEGLSYWTYGMSYFTAFADLLSLRTDNAIDLLAAGKVRAIAEFQEKCYFDGGHTVSFSDADAHDTFRIGITNYLTQYFHHELKLPPQSSAASFGTDDCARWCQMFRDFVWTAGTDTVSLSSAKTVYDPTVCTTPQVSACVLPDAKWMIFSDTAANAGAIKGGHNGEPHNHNDIGSFFFLLHGSEVLTDLGAGEYTKDSFSDKRYTIFTNNSFSHSVPIINGNGQKTGSEYAAQTYLFETDSPDAAQASMDIACAYGDDTLLSLIRHLTFAGQSHSLCLCDCYHFSKAPVSLTERFVTCQKPELGDHCVILYSEAGESCRLSFDADRLEPSLSTDIHYRHSDGTPQTVYLIDFALKQPEALPTLTFTLSW